MSSTYASVALDEDPAVSQHTLRRTHWLSTSALIIADIVGNGILTLPNGFVQMGWITGSILLILCWPLNFFTGYLLNKVHLAYPTSVTFGDIGVHVGGTIGGYIGFGTLYFYLLMLLGDYFIVLSNALQGIVWSSPICQWQAGLVTAMLLIPSNQLRTLHALTLLSVFSFVTIVLVLSLYLWTITRIDKAGNHWSCGNKPLHHVESTLSFVKAASKFVFAFSGQKIFLEMQAEMKQPERFLHSMHIAFPLLVLAYGFVSVVSFARCGIYTPGNILDALGYDWTRIVANILLFGHIAVSYTIAQQVVSRAIASRCIPSALQDGVQARISWFILTTALMVFALVISNMVPLFEDFVCLLGALFSTQMTFSFPCLLYLGTRRLGKINLNYCLDKLILVIVWLLLFLDVFLTIFGTHSAIKGIVHNARTIAPPFGCLCRAKSCLAK